MSWGRRWVRLHAPLGLPCCRCHTVTLPLYVFSQVKVWAWATGAGARKPGAAKEQVTLQRGLRIKVDAKPAACDV